VRSWARDGVDVGGTGDDVLDVAVQLLLREEHSQVHHLLPQRVSSPPASPPKWRPLTGVTYWENFCRSMAVFVS